MAKIKVINNKFTRFMYSMYSDFEYSFNYLHQDKRMPSEPKHPKRLSEMKIDSNLQWRAMKMQMDYDLTKFLIKFDKNKYSAGQVLANGRSSGKCISYESEVQLENGCYYKVKDLINNEFKIQSFDEYNKTIMWADAYCIDNGIEECFEISTINHKTVVSWNHPIMTKSGWVNSENISLDDSILTINGYEDVIEIENVGKKETASITVPDIHTHIVDGIVSHNTSSIEHILIMRLLTEANQKTGYVVFGEKHYADLNNSITEFFKNNIFARELNFRHQRDHRRFSTCIGHTVETRILGHDKTGEKQLVALHVDWGIVDECVDYDTKILLEDGSEKKIGDVVENKINLPIISYSAPRGRYESKKIINWFKKPLIKQLYELEFENGMTIKCTENHKFKTTNKTQWVKAKDLTLNSSFYNLETFVREDVIKWWEDENNIKSFCIGKILGDVHISKSSKTRSENARLKINHGYKQKEYVDICYKMLKSYTTTPPKMSKKKTGYGSINYSFTTLSNSVFTDLYNMFIKDDVKTITEEIFKDFNELSLAIWFMDDGYISKNGTCCISSHSFSYDENVILLRLLENKFEIKGYIKIDKRKDLYFLGFDQENRNKIINIIKPYIINSMLYKILISSCNLQLKSIKKIEKNVEYVYDIEVETNHNYIANGILVHNSQLIPIEALKELTPTVKKGGFFTYAGVPNDRRDTALWAGVSNPNMMYHKYSSIESVDWDEARAARELAIHGSESSLKYRNLVCFTPDMKVFTKDGLKFIKDVKVGEYVITDKNRYKKVYKTFCNKYDGDIIFFKQAYDSNHIKCTPNHRILTKDGYVFADDLKEKESRVLFPKLNRETTLTEFDVEKEEKGVYKYSKNKYSVTICENDGMKTTTSFYGFNSKDEAKMKYNIESWKRFKENGFYNDFDTKLQISNDLMFMVGLYIAEGSDYNSNNIAFSLHEDELFFKDTLNKVFKSEPSIYYHKKDKGIRLTYVDKTIKNLLRKITYGNTYNKKFMFNFVDLLHEHKISLLRGLFYGDGCIRFRTNNSKSLHISYTTVSENLAYQLRLLLRTVGINCSISKNIPKNEKHKTIFNVGVYGNNAFKLYSYFYNVDFYNKNITKKMSTFKDGSMVTNIKKEKYNGYVYNLSVEEDESYCVFDSVVHNCGEWNEPSSTAFNITKLMKQFVTLYEYRRCMLNVNNYESAYNELLLSPKDFAKYHCYCAGMDIGYTQEHPTSLVIFGKSILNDEDEYYLVGRYQFYGDIVNIAKMVHLIVNHFEPIYMGIDGQNAGEYFRSVLINNKIFPNTHEYMNRIITPYISNSPIVTDIIETPSGKQEKKTSRKCHATDEFNRLIQSKCVFFASEELNPNFGKNDMRNMLEVLQGETQIDNKSRIGGYTYKNHVDEDTVDAIRFFTMAKYDFENADKFKTKRKKLILPHFIKNKYERYR